MLPFIHLCSCFVMALAHIDFGYLFWIDAPVSVFILALGYDHDRLLVWLLLFGIIGTLWWYIVSVAGAFCWIRISAIRNRRTPPTQARSSSG